MNCFNCLAQGNVRRFLCYKCLNSVPHSRIIVSVNLALKYDKYTKSNLQIVDTKALWILSHNIIQDKNNAFSKVIIGDYNEWTSEVGMNS